MFGKLIATILTIGMTACGLLVMRQQRFDTAHDICTIHARLLEHERALWQMRVQVHEWTEHGHLSEMIRRYEQETGQSLIPFILEDCIRRCQPQDDADPSSVVSNERTTEGMGSQSHSDPQREGAGA